MWRYLNGGLFALTSFFKLTLLFLVALRLGSVHKSALLAFAIDRVTASRRSQYCSLRDRAVLCGSVFGS